MAFSLSRLLRNKAHDTNGQHGDTVEAIISDVENRPFGVSENNVLFAGLNELGGYFFFQTVIVGALHVKSKTGAELVFKGDDFNLKLSSDMPEFESERSNIKGRSVTKIDFQVEESQVKKLEQAALRSIQINVKKHNLLFSRYANAEASNEEE